MSDAPSCLRANASELAFEFSSYLVNFIFQFFILTLHKNWYGFCPLYRPQFMQSE